MQEGQGMKLDWQEIVDTLPHRPPLLLVDRVENLIPGEMVHAIKCISSLDPYFAGHFPEQPMFPGVYIIEGLAQASALLCFKTMAARGEAPAKKCVLTSVDSAKFRKPVVPGDVLHYFARIEKSRGNFVWIAGEAKVGNEVVAEVKLAAMIGNPLDKKGTAK